MVSPLFIDCSAIALRLGVSAVNNFFLGENKFTLHLCLGHLDKLGREV